MTGAFHLGLAFFPVSLLIIVLLVMSFHGKLRTRDVVVSAAQFLCLLPACYGLLLCTAACSHVSDISDQLARFSALLTIREFFDGFLLMLGVTLAVATVTFSAWIRHMSATYFLKVKRPFHADNVLVFGTGMTVILIAIAMPAYVELHQVAAGIRTEVLRNFSDVKDWADAYKSISEIAGLNPTSFFTGGTLAIIAPLLAAIAANAYPKGKDS
jgi:hypothetical protein